jgi:hypothetical protein
LLRGTGCDWLAPRSFVAVDMATQPERVSVEPNQPMEGIMNLRALIVLGFAAFIAQPALAQTTPTVASASSTVQVSVDSLLAAGYEVKAVNVMSDAATKEVFTNQTGLSSQVFITLQKGNSVATCVQATVNWIVLSDAAMTDATRCYKR